MPKRASRRRPGSRFDEGLAVRRSVLGRRYVDESLRTADDFTRPLQELVTEYCWGAVWTRPGLPRKTRSLLNLAMLTALNRPHEVRLHVRGALAERMLARRDHGDAPPDRHLLRRAGGHRQLPDRARGAGRAATLTPMRVGLVGLGNMGRPMAARIRAAGLPLTVHDLRAEVAREVAAECGATVAPSLAALGAASDVAVTMLPDGVAVRHAVLGPGDALRGGLRGRRDRRRHGVVVADRHARARGDARRGRHRHARRAGVRRRPARRGRHAHRDGGRRSPR